MLRLIFMGLLAGLFFSSTFVLNRMMSLEGGHWVWSASLRYAYMILILLILTPLLQGIQNTVRLCRYYFRHWLFWTVSGTIGFGGFYSLICFSADHAPGWIIATTWQLTIIASLIVLIGFGRSFPRKIWLFSGMVFCGVVMANFSQAEAVNAAELCKGAFPVLLAAFCYPIGNQLVWEAKSGRARLPDIRDALLENPFNKVLLLSLGSIPFWMILVLVQRPSLPSGGQLVNTAMVAVFSGVIATSLFLNARNGAAGAGELAAVDATQSSEVVFAMLGEMLLLNSALPGGMALAGIFLVIIGLMLFIWFQEVVAPAGK